MAVKNFLTGLTGRSGVPLRGQANASSQASVALRLRILDEYDLVGISWIWATDSKGVLVYLSDGAVQEAELAADDLIGKPLIELFETDSNSSQSDQSRSLPFQLKSRLKIRDQVVRLHSGNSGHKAREIWWSLSGQPVYDASGEFSGYRGSASDVTLEHKRNLVDAKLADFDSLTGLSNRDKMQRQIDATLATFKASGRSCALMMLDLDKFKRVNDTLGHQAGDTLLIEVAKRLQSVVGNWGKIGRLGGDEFQIMIADEDDRGKLGKLAEKIIQIVSQPYALEEGKRAIIGASVGIAVAPFDGETTEELTRSADMALYASKNGGRGQFRFYATDLKNEEQERQIVLDDLREALDLDQLSLHYQPVVAIETGHVVGLEALLRWEHPERGFVSPGQFIPIAEDSDLINNLGEWALRTACHAATKWPKSLRVAVNVSAVQFANPGLPAVVANALAHSGLEPDRLELELTESIFVGDNDEIEKTFAQLKGLGVRLALDDFGTGYSSLSYLRSAPFDKIKVDKSFVDSCVQKDKNSAKIIAAIIGLANALNMETTVEGVEAFDQLEVVKRNGAKTVQGFIYSRPISEDVLLQLIEAGEFKIAPDGPQTYRPDRRSVFRRIGVIHEDYYYNAVMRNLSRSGAGIEGIVGVDVGTDLVLDLGEGQMVVCKAVRSSDAEIGVEFETELTTDGSGGLCTRHRVSPYSVAAAGLPKQPGTAGPTEGMRDKSKPKFFEVSR